MIRFYKGNPSRFIIKFNSGKIKKKGIGISFYYMDHNTSIVSIPVLTIDSHFIFNEITRNFQSITIQGHFTYKISDPLKMSEILDFQINPKNNSYITEDPEKLENRIKNVIQMLTRNEIKTLDLEEALALNTNLADQIFKDSKESINFTELGVEILSMTFNSITPTPTIAKALEADYREGLQRKADESIYSRRAAAVEQERKIKENELSTAITLEERKQELIELTSKNSRQEAEYKAYAKQLELELYEKLDPKVVMAMSFWDLAKNSSKIGNLTITSEILASLLAHN